jgi:hypothetical protein
MTKVLLFFYLDRKPQEFVKTINSFLSNLQNKQDYEMVIHINANSPIEKNEKLKAHLNKYKNTTVLFDTYKNKYHAFNKTLSEGNYTYDILLPFINDVLAVKSHWDKIVRESLTGDIPFVNIDKIPAIKKEHVEKKKNLFNHTKVLACKQEFYTTNSKEGIFKTEDVIDFSYIICYRHSDDRYTNLLKTLSWLENFNCEVLIVEQDEKEKVKFDKTYINHIFTYSDQAFNRSWAFNCGALETKSNIIVFGDCDLIIDVDQFRDSVTYMKTTDCQCLSPFNKVIDLKQDESTTVDIDTWKDIQRNSRQGINLTGGIVLYKKDAFMKIAGWNEDFTGWGGEDDYMSYKSQTFLKCGVKPYRCYHLWHTPAKKIPELYKNNLGILQRVRGRDKQSFLKEFDVRRDIIGDKEKIKKKMIQ